MKKNYNSVHDEVINHIQKKGYITIDTLMKKCLSASAGSYYKSYNPIIGEKGDFVTAPEISQVFGEIIGLWAIEQYYNLGSSKHINIVEFGPGKGTLMKDFLRTAKLDAKFYSAIDISLLEINPTFIELQKLNLADFNFNITWSENITNLPPIPTIFIANEFFDALPTKQYIKTAGKWHERVVTLNNKQLKYDMTPISFSLNANLTRHYIEAGDNAIVETSPQAHFFMKLIAKHIRKYGGSALIIDYGYNIAPKERLSSQYLPSLQGVSKHQFYPVLSNLGETDLSAHVDFYRLKQIAHKANIVANDLLTQNQFLINYGIKLRYQQLAQNLPPNEQTILAKQIQYLINPLKMGGLFKVLSLT